MSSKRASHRNLPEDLAVRLGQEVRKQRKARGLTQEAVADTSEVTVQMVRRLEAGRANPTLGTLHAVAAAMGTTMSRLLRILEED